MSTPAIFNFIVAKQDLTVTVERSFEAPKFFNAFANKDEDLQLPGSDRDLSFEEHNGRTIVSIASRNDPLDRMERMMEMGFKEGFTAGLDQLDQVLAAYNN